jgi:gamma-glutamyltranspeptidase
MSPSILLDENDRVWLIGGASGGPHIITGTAQVFLNVVARGMDLLSAVFAPRIHHQLLPDVLCVENYTYVSGNDLSL